MKLKLIFIKAGLWTVAFIFSLLVSTFSAYSQEVTIVYTGNAYSSLYPCGKCPASAGGGVLRRATVLGGLKNEKKNLIIIDSGNFTGSGDFDADSINPKMDKKRSEFYYQAMKEVGYEVLGLGEAEFAFGKDFLESKIKESGLKYVSSNLNLEGISPYYIKEFPDFKVGFIGLSPKYIYKKHGINIEDYAKAAGRAIEQIQDRCDLIILISSIGDDETKLILRKFSQIKIAFSSGLSLDTHDYEIVGEAVIFKPSYQAKELRLVDITVGRKGNLEWSFDKRALSLDLEEDSNVKKIIPTCFRDQDCASHQGLVSVCQKGGDFFSSCSYVVAEKINATIITDKDCSFCSTELSEEILKGNFLGIQFRTIDYKEAEAEAIIKKYAVKTLPLVIVDSKVEEEKRFKKFETFFEKKQEGLLLSNEASGIFLYLDRPPKPNRIDLFLDFYGNKSQEVFKDLAGFAKENKIELVTHLIISDKSVAGYPEEEIKAALVVGEIYPKKINEYIYQRISSIKSVSWISTVAGLGLDYNQISEVLNSQRIDELMSENSKLIDELSIEEGNIILVKNNRIFKIFSLDKKGLIKFFR